MARNLTIDSTLNPAPHPLVQEEAHASEESNDEYIQEHGRYGANVGLEVRVDTHVEHLLLLPTAVVHAGVDEVLRIGTHYMYLGFYNNFIYTLWSHSVTCKYSSQWSSGRDSLSRDDHIKDVLPDIGPLFNTHLVDLLLPRVRYLGIQPKALCS